MLLPDLHELILEFRADLGSLERLYFVPGSPRRRARLDRLCAEWQARVEALDPGGLAPAGQLDRRLLLNHLADRRRRLEMEAATDDRLLAILPFTPSVVALVEAQATMEREDPRHAAERLTAITHQVTPEGQTAGADAYLAAERVKALREALGRWHAFHDGYDPTFSWWTAKPYEDAATELQALEVRLREEAGREDAIPGTPVGREALVADLAADLIPHTPEELIEIGEREYAWCEREMIRAATELGFGEDWRAALEHVKNLHLPPGEQPAMVRELALEAVEWVESRGLLTIPDLAKETWRMEMMSPERQKVSPFFLGGETIIVSYPTHTMTHAEKLMSMRGNNPHFSRATVQHELIPGHHLQFFMLARHRPYRELFSTPFWIEGWTLYWELLLWDLGFPRGPEDRIGMLFWRMHRCVRVVFSLRFHMGEITPAECVEMLVQRVGHERANAEGEVRRSFNGSYPPLYQAAYLIGGLLFRDLRREFVDSGRMTDREFHDRIMQENQMPPAFLREALGESR